ncbi:oligosaccharide flippase family protein [Vibrio owensii]|uniref:oligosaccharide flippase family protein n=1 Tax=Vibrio owensii TaxID=696485 RepID=UPI0009972CC5|nr:oligosaccharide flippase family protein [Vibrio owensii]AQW57895.1 hypothetical protein A9237_07085 [Vibrio owensii]
MKLTFMRNKEIKSLFFVMTYRYSYALINAIFFVLVTRFLDLNDVGVLTYSQALVAIFSVFALQSFSPRVIAQYQIKKDREILWDFFMARLLMATMMSLAIFLILYIKFSFIVALIASSLIIFLTYDSLYIYFDSRGEQYNYARTLLPLILFTTAMKILILLKFKSLNLVLLSMAVELFAMLFMMLIILKLHAGPIIISIIRGCHFIRENIKEAFPIILSGLIFVFFTKSDIFILEKIEGTEAVAQLASATRIFEGLALSTSVLINVFYSKLSCSYTSKIDYKKEKKKFYIKNITISTLISVLMFVFSDVISEMLYSNEYTDTAILLKIYAFVLIGYSIALAIGRVFILEGRIKALLYRNVCALLINISLCIYLITTHGVIGAGYAVAISWFASTAIMVFLEVFKNNGKSINI